MYKLISGENAAKKNNSIKWDLECQKAFDKLKELCTTTPILAYTDFGKPFKLHTDASVLGLGTLLYQVKEGVEKVISHASHSLTKFESKYPVHKLEFLCLKWVITDQFHEYLYGNTFDVYTDNNPLTYVLTTAKLDAMGHRWVAGLANYNFHIHYKSAITQSSGQSHPTHSEDELLASKAVSKPDDSSCPGTDLDPSLNQKCVTTSDWVEAQSQDENVGEIICLFTANELQC